MAWGLFLYKVILLELECDIGDRTLQTPISDFVDQGVQAILNTTLLFSKRLLLNVTGDRNNHLLL